MRPGTINLGNELRVRDTLNTHERKAPSSAYSLINWRTSCRTLPNRAIVAQGCIGWGKASASRFIRRISDRYLSREDSPVPFLLVRR